MKYKLYSTSIMAWDAMIEAIDMATKSIYIEMYILSDDTKHSHDFIGKLKQKARHGVKVVIVADAFGSKALKDKVAPALQKTGIEFLFFSNWLRHIHRKILIVDERIAFIGGVNIGKKFAHWNDLQIKISGRIVKKILRSFAYTYEMAGGKDRRLLKYREKKFTAKIKIWLLEHSPIKNVYTLKNHYVKKIRDAKSSIYMTTPYFTPPRWLISLLDDAIRRGVRVEVLIPKKADWKIMNLLNYRYIRILHPMGIHFFLSKKMNHSKLLIIDEEEALIGSQNIDLISFKLNSEVGIFFKDQRIIKELTAIIKQWKTKATKFKPQNYKLRYLDYLIMAIMKLLHPIL